MKIEEYIEFIQSRCDNIIKIARNDYAAGRNDCVKGIYDKWYRYNRQDDGTAYDLGWCAQNAETLNESVNIIEVNKLL